MDFINCGKIHYVVYYGKGKNPDTPELINLR